MILYYHYRFDLRFKSSKKNNLYFNLDGEDYCLLNNDEQLRDAIASVLGAGKVYVRIYVTFDKQQSCAASYDNQITYCTSAMDFMNPDPMLEFDCQPNETCIQVHSRSVTSVREDVEDEAAGPLLPETECGAENAITSYPSGNDQSAHKSAEETPVQLTNSSADNGPPSPEPRSYPEIKDYGSVENLQNTAWDSSSHGQQCRHCPVLCNVSSSNSCYCHLVSDTFRHSTQTVQHGIRKARREISRVIKKIPHL